MIAPFTTKGTVTAVLALANEELDKGWKAGFVPQSIDYQVLSPFIKLTYAWDNRVGSSKQVKFAYSNDINDYRRGGVFSANRWSAAFELDGIDWYLGLRNKI